MTTAEIGEAVLKAEGIEATKTDAQAAALSIQHSLKNHEGKASKSLARRGPPGGGTREAANGGP
jgi:hypothetical protein